MWNLYFGSKEIEQHMLNMYEISVMYTAFTCVCAVKGRTQGQLSTPDSVVQAGWKNEVSSVNKLHVKLCARKLSEVVSKSV